MMRCDIIIDKAHDEAVIIYAHERTRLVEEIEQMVMQEQTELTGYIDKRIYKLTPKDIYCFISDICNRGK